MKKIALVFVLLLAGCSGKKKDPNGHSGQTKKLFETDIYYNSILIAAISQHAKNGETKKVLELTNMYFETLPQKIALLEQAAGEPSLLRKYDLSEQALTLKASTEESSIPNINNKRNIRIIPNRDSSR